VRRPRGPFPLLATRERNLELVGWLLTYCRAGRDNCQKGHGRTHDCRPEPRKLPRSVRLAQTGGLAQTAWHEVSIFHLQ